MRSKIKLNPSEELKFISSKSKGNMGQTDINTYSIVNSEGGVVGSVIHEDHTSLNGFKRTQHVTQTDKNGKVIVQETW